MANTLKIKRGTAATIPQGQLAEPLFTTDTYDLYIGKGSGGNQRFQKYIASGTSSQFLKGDGSLDSTTYQATSEKGQNNGYASLDAGGKIPVSQLPSSVIEYKGTWNASTNTPTLADGTGDAGDVYIVSVGGTQNLGSGSITFDAGDWVMYNGSVWQKSTGSNAVASVNGQTGIVSIGINDLDDTTITSITGGQLLQYNSGTSKWINWTPTYISAAITSLNGLTAATQTFAVGTSGTDFAVSSSTSTHTFNLPDASASARGVVTTATQTFAGNKTFSDLLYGNQHIYFGMSTGADYYVRTPNVSTSRRGLFLSNGVNTDLKVYAGGTQTLGAWTESDTTLVIGTGYQGGGGSNETILFHSTGIGNLMAITASSGGAIYAYRNIILPANNTVGGTNYAIQQTMASNDQWRIYGNSVAIDQGELVFELADNAQSWGSNGQRYRFYFNNTSTGTSKDVLIMDYDTAVFTTSVTATSIIRSGGTSSQFLKADGSVDSTSYLPLSGGTLTGSLTATAFIPSGSTIPTNGMYLPSANTVAFAANSTRVIQISDSGRVSIGATTPTADTLTVHGAITTTNGGKITAQGMIEAGSTIFGGLNCIIVSDLSAASITPTGSTSPVNGMYLPSANTIAFSTLANPRMTITSGGNVAIGTTDPNIYSFGGALFTLSSTTTYANMIIAASSTNSAGISFGNQTIRRAEIEAADGSNLIFKTNTGNSGTGVAQKMIITSGGNVGIGVTPTATAGVTELALGSSNTNPRISGIRDGANAFVITSASPGTDFYERRDAFLRFGTNNTERMTITSGGNVGIGTNNPTGAAGLALVLNSGASQGRICIKTSATGDASGDGLQIGMSGIDAFIEQRENADLTFATNASERMRITSGGNVLIGTTSDNGGRLQVSGGDVRVSGGVRFSSSGADANRWSVYWNGGTGDLIVVNNISDIRAKKDFDYNIKGLETIQKLKPLKFTWKDGTSHSTSVSGRLRQYGFIAQETMEADDFLAWYNESQDSWGIEQYESFSAVIVKAIQEQQAQIEELKSKL